MGVLLMTDLSKLSETELLAIWNKDNFGLKGQLYKLEQEYSQDQGKFRPGTTPKRKRPGTTFP